MDGFRLERPWNVERRIGILIFGLLSGIGSRFLAGLIWTSAVEMITLMGVMFMLDWEGGGILLLRHHCQRPLRISGRLYGGRTFKS